MSIVLMSDRRVAGIPLHECGEPLVDIRLHGGIRIDPRKRDASAAFTHLRQGVLDRLLDAQALLPDGMRLLFVEGYRPPALQQRYFEEYADQLSRDNPDWPPARLREAASRYVSPPEIAPHSAGAAVDVTVVDDQGREVDMGTRMNASPEESNGACYTDAANIDATARAMRGILSSALSSAGLTNYPTEWWHWSWGDRYWALQTGRPTAIYGPTELP